MLAESSFISLIFRLSSSHRTDITHNPPAPLSSPVHMSRVRPGKCYHLYNGLRASLLDAYQLPEIMRTPLEELCLQIKVVYVQRKRETDLTERDKWVLTWELR